MSKRVGHPTHHPTIRGNYTATIVSLTIMLYWLGVCGMVAIYAHQLFNYSKEQLAFYIELKDDANEAMVFAFQKKLEASSYTKPQTVTYISKEDGLEMMKDEEGLTKEEVMLFGENLLPNIIQFSIKEEYFSDYEGIITDIKSNNFVSDVFYEKAPAKNLATKVYRLEIILFVLMIFFIFVVVTLIKNTLKLVLVANKQITKTMQLVGATWERLSKPYLRQSLKNGWWSALIAVVCLWLTRFLFESGWGQLDQIDFWTTLLSVIILITGLLLSWICTRHSVRKYLTKPVDEWEL